MNKKKTLLVSSHMHTDNASQFIIWLLKMLAIQQMTTDKKRLHCKVIKENSFYQLLKWVPDLLFKGTHPLKMWDQSILSVICKSSCLDLFPSKFCSPSETYIETSLVNRFYVIQSSARCGLGAFSS